ncbi:MAG: hypothetical protein KBG15_07870, partial [Kofleriaceae bacterium]|nr:hypothetical protein [Kofleriaceae bacterium]
TATVRQARAPEIRVAIAPRTVADLAAQQTQPLTAPHRPAVPVPGTTVAPLANYASLRTLVGVRTTRTSLEQVLTWRYQLSDVPAPAAAQISDVVAQARASATYWDAARLGADTPAHLNPGDLLVFDHAIDDAPASLLGLVATTDDRGVSEFFYVAAGVIRRGFVDPKRPALARDAERRIVNTFLRHNQNQPPAGTRFLAGELFAGAVRP